MTEKRIILVRYDEIGLKGKNRKFFEKCLIQNIRKSFNGIEGVSIQSPQGRLILYTDENTADECVRRLNYVPGIASMSIGISVERDFDAMAEVGIRLIQPHLQAQGELKFCVRSQRSDKSFSSTSPEIDFEVGSRIMKALSEKGLTVNINHGDFVLEIEIGQSEDVVFDNRTPGLGGLPVGSSGNVLCLLSGGIDSPVAAYLLAKRGCRVHFIFFDNQVFLGRGGYDKVVKLSKLINRYRGRGRLYVVPFQDIQVAIRDHCTPDNRVVLYGRMMYRIAQKLAEQNKCQALVTGESLGQVASQTLENLAAVSDVVTGNVFRPLIGMDKKEIIVLAKKIETYETSIEPQPDCCSVFMPPRPATKSRIPILERDEGKFPWQELMDKAIADIEIIEP